MSVRTLAFAAVAATLLAACSESSTTTAPSHPLNKPALVIDAGVVCTGVTMPVADCQALVSIYNTTNGPGWATNAGWGTDPNPCDWVRVFCKDGDHGPVEELDFTALGLTGPFPAAIADLTQLEVLRLDINALTGSIPAALGGLTNLELLGVSSNDLTGPIPPELGNLPNLRILALGRNDLGGTIPASLGSLSNLEILQIPFAGLTGSIPAALGNLPKLHELELSGNSLTGAIPAALGNMPALEVLYLDNNQLSGPIPAAFANLPKLEQLWLQFNALTGPIPTALTQLSTLELLFAYNNQLTGQIPLAVAVFGEGLNACDVDPNAELYLPDLPTYRAADTDGNGKICGLPFASAEDIGEDAIDEIDDLVPATLNEGQANALKTKIANAMEKAAKGQFNAAINQMQSFLTQLNDMIAGGTLTPAQAAPFVEQAQTLIAIWTAML
jgi:Leucine Rich Repeat (LRR) protein/FIMAH domain-containing protein